MLRKLQLLLALDADRVIDEFSPRCPPRPGLWRISAAIRMALAVMTEANAVLNFLIPAAQLGGYGAVYSAMQGLGLLTSAAVARVRRGPTAANKMAETLLMSIASERIMDCVRQRLVNSASAACGSCVSSS